MSDQTEMPFFDPSGFAIRKPSDSEQRTLPIRGTIQGEYDAWRATELGQHIYDVIRYRALALVRAGEARIGMKALFEWARSTQKVTLDNNYTALVARELLDREPELRDVVELRQRTAA